MSVRVVRSGALDDEHVARAPVVGGEVRLYGALDKLKKAIGDVNERVSDVVERASKMEQFQTRVNRLSEALDGVHSRVISVESGTEMTAVISVPDSTEITLECTPSNASDKRFTRVWNCSIFEARSTTSETRSLTSPMAFLSLSSAP